MKTKISEENLGTNSASAPRIVPNDLELLPFQKEAIRKMVRFLNERQCAYNACEQGLGKSIQTIAVLNYYRMCVTHKMRTLIVCPKAMLYTWEQEVKKWSTCELNIKVVEGKQKLHELPDCDVIIIAYSLLGSNVPIKTALAELRYDFLVMDEAFYIKNKKTQRTKTVLGMFWPISRYKIALAGTVFTQSVLDAHTLFSRMCPEHFENFWKFANTYAVLKRTPWGDKWEGVKNTEQLSKIIREKFFVRYLKKDVLKDLPPKRWSRITLPKEYDVKLLSKDKEDETRKGLEKYLTHVQDGKTPPVPSHLAHYRRLQGVAKIPAVCDFVSDLLEQKIPVILFAYHKDVIDAYKEKLKVFNPVVITGATSAIDRQLAINYFQGETPNSPDKISKGATTNLFIGQIQAAGVGITLTRASNVVFAEFDWSPASIAQASDRCHRYGTTLPVTCYYFMVQGSIDEALVSTVIKKAKDFAKVTDVQ